MLKFSSKTNNNNLVTQATTLNSFCKMKTIDNEPIDAPSMFLRTPKEKDSIENTPVLD